MIRTAKPDSLSEGYTTDAEKHWVCDACFEDFRERFQWTTRERLPTGRPDTAR
jgi:hypothetical protein